jgi:hypothetical protein
MKEKWLLQFAEEAFIVLVHIYEPDGTFRREEYLVACLTREAAEERIRSIFSAGAEINVFASPLGHSETVALGLLANEIRQRQ